MTADTRGGAPGLRESNGRVRTLALVVALTFATPLLADARWPQFRGPNASGVAEAQKPPIEFGPTKNLLWKTPVPRGQSSPCVWDDRIFLTGFENGKLLTLCIRRSDGKELWRQIAPADRLERGTNPNGPATPSPVTDGAAVYVHFGSFGLLAYDFEGKELWRKSLALGYVRHGTGTSPIIAAGKLVVVCDQEGMKSFMLAVNPRTGETLWQIPRPNCFSSHTTPVHRKVETPGGPVDELVVAGSIRLIGYDLKDGSERWSCRGLEAISICPTPVIGEGGAIFAMSQSMGDERLAPFDALLRDVDKNGDARISMGEATKIVRDVFSILDTDGDKLLSRAEWDAYYDIFRQADSGLFAVRAPDRAGDLTATHVLWRQKRGVTEVASPLCYRGRVFVIATGGLASCFDAATGRPIYQSKRVGAPGQYFASPVAADGRAYVASSTGTVSVVEIGDEPKTLARNDLGEGIQATPAIADNKLYVRTAGHLWAFGG